ILMHAIRCGNDPDTGRVWAQIASTSGGTYATINQSGGVVVAKTPMDKRVRELSSELAATAIFYGDDDERRNLDRKLAHVAGAPEPMAADRGGFLAKKVGAGGGAIEGDVLGGIASGRVGVRTLDPAKLPPAMRPMSPAERERYANEQANKRARLQKD